MCCEKITSALENPDLIWAWDDETKKRARSTIFKLVTTCYGDCGKTIKQGLGEMLKEQQDKEKSDGRTLHANALLAVLQRVDDEIVKRREGLIIARELLGAEFDPEFKKIEGQLA